MMFFTGALALAANATAQDRSAVIAALRDRYKALDRLRLEFDWHEDKCPKSSDPFDPRNWLRDPKLSLDRKYRMALVRPEFRVEIEEANRPTIITNWLGGERVSKARQADGVWHVEINADRWSVTGPLPFLTPLELHQTFDVRHGLLELLENGTLDVRSRSRGLIEVAGGPITPQEEWMLRAQFDPQRQMLPVVVAAELKLPTTRISWEMRTIASDVVNGVHVVKEAIQAMNNSAGSFPRTYQIFHFLATRVEYKPELSRKDLEVTIPERNVSIIDEIRLYHRKLGADGRVLHQEKWTAEERRQDLAVVSEQFQKNQAARASVEQRRSRFKWLVAAAAVATLSLVGVVAWSRRRRAA